MWFGCGPDVARTWLGCSSDVAGRGEVAERRRSSWEVPVLTGPNRAIQLRCAMRLESRTPKSLAMRKTLSCVTGEHWTGSPNKSIDQTGKNCPKMSETCVFRPSGQFWGIFRTFFRHFRTFCRHSLFLGCPTICPLQP